MNKKSLIEGTGLVQNNEMEMIILSSNEKPFEVNEFDVDVDETKEGCDMNF